MILADSFLAPARARGFDFYTGVPCSSLTPLLDAVIGDTGVKYVGATSEGEAVAIAAGAWLAGKSAVVMCQNSGLGNMINPLTSLNYPFRIPALLIVTWRGQPGLGDEPQHELMGRVTCNLLETIGIGHASFPRAANDVAAALDIATMAMEEISLPYALIMEKGSIRDDGLEQSPPAKLRPGSPMNLSTGGVGPTRFKVLERLLAEAPEQAAIITTTGKCGRELYLLGDREQHLYQVGSMGCASAMALGVALNSSRRVIVLDGDGAALMKMGNLATIGAQGPENLTHILLDNGVHDSTGGQATVSATVDFSAVAAACGYRRTWICDDLEGFAAALDAAAGNPGPHFLHIRIAPGSMENLPRPGIAPADVARRFRSFVLSDAR